MTDIGAARGARLGLPADGPGSVAPAGRRLAGFVVDVLASALVAGAFTAPALPGNWSLLVLFCEYAFFTATFGQTPGMRLVGIGLVRLDGARLDLLRAALRTVLLVLVVPAVVFDSDQRGLHDRWTGSVTVRTR